MNFHLLIFLGLAFISCKEQSNSDTSISSSQLIEKVVEPIKPGFIHAVYFWLNQNNSELRTDFVEKGLPALAKIPSIQSVSWGPPAIATRKVVDGSYDIAWIVTFTSEEHQEAYQVDPLHLEFVEKYKSLFDSIKVYDNFVNHFEAN